MNGDNHLLNVLTRAGVLINVSVRFWRGCKKLKPEDIGLDQDQISDRLISLGHKRLLPKEATAALTLVEGRAHALVEANTFPFLNGLGHFLPNGRLEEVTGKLKTLEQEFWNAKQQFVNQYGSLRAQASEEWKRMVDKLSSDPDRVLATIEDSFPAIGPALGRSRVLLLGKQGVELPSDLSGLLMKQFDDSPKERQADICEWIESLGWPKPATVS